MSNTRIPLPQHTREKTLRTKNGITHLARVPYNFVPLPQNIVLAETPPDHDHYQGNTGWIECEIETLTPLYVRGLLTADDFRDFGEKRFDELNAEQQNRRAGFFAIGSQIAIPGSTLRGVLRTLVEIAGFGKMQQVGGEDRYFYRAVAAQSDDPLKKPYKEQLGQVKAGYVKKRKENNIDVYYIHPVRKIDGKETFIKAQEKYKDGSLASTIDAALPYKRFDDKDYTPQYVEVSFTWKRTSKGRIVAEKVGPPGKYSERGWMVCSGNMIESAKGKKPSPRHNHCIVPEQDASPKANALPINTGVVADYRAALTDAQKESPFDKRNGCLCEGRPIFYLDDGKEVIKFGHSPNFRVPFVRLHHNRASTVLDFVPEWLRNESDIDLAEAMFGYVKSSKMKEGRERTFAGRIFVGDAKALPEQADLVSDHVITPAILATPKPSSFQHYLTQPDSAAREKLKLKHFASATPNETVIRGHKLYWHRKVQGRKDYEWTGTKDEHVQAKKQLTGIKPIRIGAKFRFHVRFENLSDAELGALLWVLDLPERHAHKLGMGKPLGLGSARMTVKSLVVADCKQRYGKLLDDGGWHAGSSVAKDKFDYKTTFENYVLDRMDAGERNNAQRLAEVPRVHELLCMLAYEDAPAVSETRYMEIEHKTNGNEYKERPVLSLPSTIVGMALPTPPAAQPAANQPEPASGTTPSGITVQRNWRNGFIIEIRPDKRFGRVRDMETLQEYRFDMSVVAGNTPANKATVLFDLQGGRVVALKRR
jgi:CRISPR-associated protein (TIGR03986 family)